MEQARIGELDRATIEQARRGDTQAFARIVQRYQSPVYNMAYRMLGDPNEAQDAAQETFLRAFAQLKSYRPDQKFASWLLSIAAHYCIDRLRRRRFHWLSLDEPSAEETLPSREAGPEETAFAHERAEEVQQLVAKLAPAARAVVILKYWNDMDIDEIARVTGDTPGNVKVKLFRARQAMAREMRQLGREGGRAAQRLEKAPAHVR